MKYVPFIRLKFSLLEKYCTVSSDTSRSGTVPRHAMYPAYSLRVGASRRSLTVECTPSAPITKSVVMMPSSHVDKVHMDHANLLVVLQARDSLAGSVFSHPIP